MSSSGTQSTDPPPTLAELAKMLQLSSTKAVTDLISSDSIQFAFNEYVDLHLAAHPLTRKDPQKRAVYILTDPPPTYHNLYRWARDPPTDEPWCEVLFAWRVRNFLQSDECPEVGWGTADPKETRPYRLVDCERYGIVLEMLAWLQQKYRDNILSGVQQRIDAELELIAGVKR
ncbi:hypothetical protein F5B20DRAFT_7486 [Whalleya microplaca]|nr:hypothetical protein F5B20DRAFT_7486 [Whalleya microplaca]